LRQFFQLGHAILQEWARTPLTTSSPIAISNRAPGTVRAFGVDPAAQFLPGEVIGMTKGHE